MYKAEQEVKRRVDDRLAVVSEGRAEEAAIAAEMQEDGLSCWQSGIIKVAPVLGECLRGSQGPWTVHACMFDGDT